MVGVRGRCELSMSIKDSVGYCDSRYEIGWWMVVTYPIVLRPPSWSHRAAPGHHEPSCQKAFPSSWVRDWRAVIVKSWPSPPLGAFSLQGEGRWHGLDCVCFIMKSKHKNYDLVSLFQSWWVFAVVV